MILITGASGMVGGAVLKEVLKTGAPVAAMYRSQNDSVNIPSGVEAVLADFSKPDTLARALAGVDTVFLVCSPVPQLVEYESNMIEACHHAGVKRIVDSSALGAGDYDKSFPSWHAKVEARLKSSRIPWTILQPNGFMQNIISFNAPTIRAQNAFYGSLGDARISMIDVRDIAAIAANALTTGGNDHEGKTYELNGPEALSNAEVAAKISRAVGRTVNYVDIPIEAQKKAMADAGMPAWQVTALVELQEYYFTGKAAKVEGVAQQLLGRPPIRFDQFLADNASAFAAQAAAS
jgi:uncharacterized protein YbjT (DUF2867 family)